ncbi:MAG: HEPN domain-containing protein [Alphaproteobacteria bacterium]|nr:HEPN domain-containing protein [Alphaproteobacteria bacterium]
MSVPDPQTCRQWAEAGQWFAKADEDICVAEMALEREPPLIDPAAFHCQQAAEKIIKGLLVAAAVKVPRLHDLEALAALAVPLYPDLAPIMDDVAPASAWIARTRYPGLTDGIGAELGEVAEMLVSVKAFRREAAALGPPA